MGEESQTLIRAGCFHWTIDTFYRADEAGIFDEPKLVEMVQGDLRLREFPSPRHATATSLLGRWAREVFEPLFMVREEKPLRLADDTEPTVDIAVVARRGAEYMLRHPNARDTVFAAEVADKTEDYDVGEKARLYAQAGIQDYWVLLVQKREMIVFRAPTLEGYESRVRLTETNSLAPLAALGITISVRDLLPRVSLTTSVQEG